MKSKPLAFIVIFSFFVMILLSGCTSPDDSSIQNTLEREALTSKISLEQAYHALSETDSGSPDRIPHIYCIKGTGLSPQGTADAWIFGVKKGDTSYFVTYDEKGVTENLWPWDFDSREIIIDEQFFSPEDLFSAHPLLIQDITNNGAKNIDELELVEGEYHLTQITDSDIRVWIFDGSTGAELANL